MCSLRHEKNSCTLAAHSCWWIASLCLLHLVIGTLSERCDTGVFMEAALYVSILREHADHLRNLSTELREKFAQLEQTLEEP